MILLDERILEFLREEGPAEPSRIRDTIQMEESRNWISERCQVLADAGLACPVYGGWRYDITHLGVRYLDGAIYADGLRNKKPTGKQRV
jgi:hypothetical protein